MSSIWTDMTSAALLGSSRGVVSVALPGSLDALLRDTTDETRLLRAAGILGLAQTAAMVPPVSEAIPESAPEDDTAVGKPELESLMGRIIQNANIDLLKEACALLKQRGFNLPARLLPRALDMGQKKTVLRSPFRDVLGKRGAWLAAQNPEWKFALLAGTETADSRIWDEGDVTQRADWLAQLRSTDSTAARELLEKSFAGEAARDRALLLPALGQNLSASDEPFLSGTLSTDRSKEVRQIAAGFLSALPESDFAKRMIARIVPCVQSAKKLLRNGTVIEPPPAFEKDWKNDALEEKPLPSHKIGERAWWLQQITQLTPLGWWEQHLKLAPDEILAAASKSEWKDALLAGFREAIKCQPSHTAWKTALLSMAGFSSEDAANLALELPPAESDAALQRILKQGDNCVVSAHIIQNADYAWSQELWLALLQALPKLLKMQDWRFRPAIVTLACRIPKALLHEEIQWPDISLFSESVADFTRTLEQRRTLHKLLPS